MCLELFNDQINCVYWQPNSSGRCVFAILFKTTTGKNDSFSAALCYSACNSSSFAECISLGSDDTGVFRVLCVSAFILCALNFRMFAT